MPFKTSSCLTHVFIELWGKDLGLRIKMYSTSHVSKQIEPYFLPVKFFQCDQGGVDGLRPLLNTLCNGCCRTCAYISIVVFCLSVKTKSNLDLKVHKLTEEIQKDMKKAFWRIEAIIFPSMACQPGILFVVVVACNPQLGCPIHVCQIKWLL